MHKFTYQQGGEYRCDYCGLKTDKKNIAEASERECPNAPATADIYQELTGITDRVAALEVKVQEQADWITAVDAAS